VDPTGLTVAMDSSGRISFTLEPEFLYAIERAKGIANTVAEFMGDVLLGRAMSGGFLGTPEINFLKNKGTFVN